MGYSTNREQHVTLIENLPYMEDLDSGGNFDTKNLSNNGLTTEQFNKVNKKIRTDFHVSKYSDTNQKKEGYSRERSRQTHNDYESIMSNIDASPPIDQNQESGNHNDVQEHFKSFNMPIGSPSCLDVADHISKCPICSKFYNTDKTIYLIAIITLAIICILLLKKVLDV